VCCVCCVCVSVLCAGADCGWTARRTSRPGTVQVRAGVVKEGNPHSPFLQRFLWPTRSGWRAPLYVAQRSITTQDTNTMHKTTHNHTQHATHTQHPRRRLLFSMAAGPLASISCPLLVSRLSLPSSTATATPSRSSCLFFPPSSSF
jgi:hypothetical protein